MIGLAVDCEKCGSEFTARERSTLGQVLPAATDLPDIGTATVAKSAALTLLLLVTVAGIWYFTVTLIDRAKQPTDEPKQQQAERQPAEKRPPAPRWQFRDEPPALVDDGEPVNRRTLARYTAGGIISVLAVLYCGGMLMASLWIARTSSERGQSAVPWLLYFWFCQVALRSVPYAALGAIEAAGAYAITAGMGVVAVVAGELFGWSGLIAYRMAGYVRP